MPDCKRIIISGAMLLLVPSCARAQHLAFQDLLQSFVVTNRYYRASVSKHTGELYSVVDRLSGRTAISGDRLIIRVSGRPDALGPADFSAARFAIADGFDFYVRVVWQGTLSGSDGRHRIERTYEFTNSPYVYEQVAILVGELPSEAREPKMTLQEVTWQFRRDNVGVAISRTAEDLWTELPTGPMGGLEPSLTGHTFTTQFDGDPTNPRRRIVVSGKARDAAATSADLAGGHGLVAASLVSIVGGLPDDSVLHQPLLRFYAGYGLRQDASDSTWTFTNWNRYELSNGLIPLRRKYVDTPTADDWLEEDILIRITMHLVNRMKFDGGWPRWWAWSSAGVTYPQGDIFTAHSRDFPAMAYVWSYLTVEWKSDRWVHSQSDADVIYRQLQRLRPFYGVGPDASILNFKDLHEGVPYIAYSANRKEATGNGPKGVLNAHAQALHFAWIMKDASELGGNLEDARKWKEIIEFYHPGSRMLYRLLYPGADDCHLALPADGGLAGNCDFLSGHLGYSIGRACIYPGCRGPAAHPTYSFISHQGIAAEYLDAEEYEPEFVDAVERASRLDFNPYDRPTYLPLGSLVAQLCRVLPLALVFTRDSFGMAMPDKGREGPPQHLQYDISAASLAEVNTFARLRFQQLLETRRAHDPQRVIGEAPGKGLRKVIWTNRRFVTDWIPGFWEEKDPADVPLSLRFSVEIRPPSGGQVGNWVAYRIDNRIEVMADFDSGVAVLKLPPTGVETQYVTGYRDYDPRTLRWKDPVNEQSFSLPPGHELVLPSLARKRLVFVHLR